MNLLDNLLFPAKCPLCGDILEKRRLICEACKKEVHFIGEPRCKKCGKPLRRAETESCRDCEKSKHWYTRGICAVSYEGAMRNAVGRFKYQNKRCYAEFFTEIMWKAAEKHLRIWKPDVVIPIPLHPKRRKKRGFNQAYLLAKPIGERLGVPVLEHGLLRTVPTSPQKNLDRKKRQINLKRAFKIGADDVKLKRVLLVDDIYTTGSTIDAAAMVLRRAGAKEVFFLALGTGEGEEP
ncbi:MAG: ComF family protein [Eubacteriales bacterium]|nr:ComF family protein [Eubacteriales bacterium]